MRWFLSSYKDREGANWQTNKLFMATPLILLVLMAMAIVHVQSTMEVNTMPTSTFSLVSFMTAMDVSEVISKLERGSWTRADAQQLCTNARLLCNKDFVFVNPIERANVGWKGVPRNLLFVDGTSWFRLRSLQPGQYLELGTTLNSFPSNAFLHRQLLPLLPFHMRNLSTILSTLNIPSNSALAYGMMDTLKTCQGISGDKSIQCVMSLDEMTNFAALKLGSKLSLRMATAWEAQTVRVIESTMVANNVVACHPLTFPYRVYFCHLLPKTTLVKVVMEGSDAIEATAICHMDTASFDPNHKSFAFLNMKPGNGEICHWLAHDSIAFGI